nr:hypothetical protein [Tanacetum cinerariifolium]
WLSWSGDSGEGAGGDVVMVSCGSFGVGDGCNGGGSEVEWCRGGGCGVKGGGGGRDVVVAREGEWCRGSIRSGSGEHI